MEEVSIMTYRDIAKIDPTRTTSLRNAFATDMSRRFLELSKVIKKSIVDQDCFGLNPNPLQNYQMSPTPKEAFKFSRSSEKVDEFMVWLQLQVDRGLLEVGQFQQIGSALESAWTNRYIFDSYKRGVIRARHELKKAGYKIPSMDDTGGIEASMSTPFHIDRVGLLFTRTYNDLKGITAAMDAQISRILAQGIADGDGPALLARKIISTINGGGADKLGITDTLGRVIPARRRATMLARTEIIRAHHMATIQEYRNWALEGVIVKGEWMTAGDERVCTRCEALQGKIFTLDEIEPLIPLHPQCRCIALPYIEELQKYK